MKIEMSTTPKYKVTLVDELPGGRIGTVYDAVLDEIVNQNEKGIFKVEVETRSASTIYSNIRTRLKKRGLDNYNVCCRQKSAYIIVK